VTVALIACGALGREVRAIVARRGWDASVVSVSALDHLYPERIAADVERLLVELADDYDRRVVVYGDCGTRGALDAVLARHGVARIDGPHCYELYAGQAFAELMAAEPGTFFLTDFLVRSFEGTVIRGLGLDRFPELQADYFGHYRRVVYLSQVSDPDLVAKAGKVAQRLGLPLNVHHTGYGQLEARLAEAMELEPARG
jgi:hypothetical protein